MTEIEAGERYLATRKAVTAARLAAIGAISPRASRKERRAAVDGAERIYWAAIAAALAEYGREVGGSAGAHLGCPCSGCRSLIEAAS